MYSFRGWIWKRFHLDEWFHNHPSHLNRGKKAGWIHIGNPGSSQKWHTLLVCPYYWSKTSHMTLFYLKGARNCNSTMCLEVKSWKCTPVDSLDYTMVYGMVAIRKSYWMTTKELFFIHTACLLWVGCVSVSHSIIISLGTFLKHCRLSRQRGKSMVLKAAAESSSHCQAWR